jgi:hypothetical protein
MRKTAKNNKANTRNKTTTATGNGRRKAKKIGRKAGSLTKASTRRQATATRSSSISVAGDLKAALAAKAKAAGMSTWKSFATDVLAKASQT